MASILRNNRYFRPLFIFRDWLMKNVGGFILKRQTKKAFFLKKITFEDTILKFKISQQIKRLPLKMLSCKGDKTDIIVSLTSYGNRVKDTTPYTLYSIFTQSRLPNKVVLWLDNEHWTDDNLPSLIKRLIKSGLEVHYCEDIKSYKKLLPTLKQFPENPIIVIDDDMYYPNYLVQDFVACYLSSDKRTIFASCANIPEKKLGKYIPYAEWKGDEYAEANTEVALIGCGGGMYPPGIFDSEIFNKDIYMSLAPTADDLWFWVQSKRMGISVRLIDKHGYHLLRPVNRIEDYDVQNADNLTRTNVVLGKNEQQFEKLLSYYHID